MGHAQVWTCLTGNRTLAGDGRRDFLVRLGFQASARSTARRFPVVLVKAPIVPATERITHESDRPAHARLEFFRTLPVQLVLASALDRQGCDDRAYSVLDLG